MLKARFIKKSYGKLPISKGVDLDIQAGEIVSIVAALATTFLCFEKDFS